MAPFSSLPLIALLQSSPSDAGAGAAGALFGLAVAVVFIAAMWRIFTKAGQPGWASIIPIYNTYILLKIAGRPGWWLVLFFIPFINIIVFLLVAIDLARSFGRSSLFGVVMLWLLSAIGLLMLGFGGSRYVGPAATSKI
jgi:uncharacterized membrane protein YhaH (DUF805 family)